MASSEPPPIHQQQLTLDWREHGGFIVEARNSRSHPIVGYGRTVKPCDPDRGFCYSVNEAWRDLLHECRFADGHVMNGGRKMLLKRGELTGAVSWLAHRWNWTPMTVRVFLDKLERDGMIARHVPGASENNKHNGKVTTVITVCNYDKFQTQPEAQQPTEQQTDNKQTANKQQMNNNNIRNNNLTTKQLNNEKAVKNPPLPPAEPETHPDMLADMLADQPVPQRPDPEPRPQAARPAASPGGGEEKNQDLLVIREGEDHVGFGVLVNCETVRHAKFEINLNGIATQLGGRVPLDRIKEVAVGHALQWATDLAAGKNSLPRYPANLIRASVKAQHDAEHKASAGQGFARATASGGELGKIESIVQATRSRRRT